MPDNAIKLLDLEKGLIEGLAIPFGGPFDGKDFDGEFFSKDTDFRPRGLREPSGPLPAWQGRRDPVLEGWYPNGSETD